MAHELNFFTDGRLIGSIKMSTNHNPTSGIRYGIIAMNSLDGDLAEVLWVNGNNVSEEEAIKEIRAEVEAKFDLFDCDYSDEIEREIEDACMNLQVEEPTITGNYEGVEYMISWLGGSPLVWVLKSPHMTYRSLCGPCIPDGGDLDSGFDPHGNLMYNVPPDWRRA